MFCLLGTTKVDHTSYFSDVGTKLFEVFRKYENKLRGFLDVLSSLRQVRRN